MDVGIVGGSGYGGAELLRLLASHPALKIKAVGARAAAGQPIAGVFPHLPEQLGAFLPARPESFEGCALVFLATPAEASLELVPALLEQGCAVVDLSGAYRLDAATFARAYGQQHPHPDLAPAAFGLPELFREDLQGARLVANPGCYPTAALLALAGLVGLVDRAGVVVVGLSGTSGAGKGLRDDLHVSHAGQNVAPYGAPGHRHTPEIAAGWARACGVADAALTFVPHLVPMARGLVCTVTARLTGDPDAVRHAVVQRFAREPFVRVLEPGAWPATTHVRGSNMAHVGVAVDRDAGTVVAACAIDNLVKGAAGQAIQNANRLLGLPEELGLPQAGLYP